MISRGVDKAIREREKLIAAGEFEFIEIAVDADGNPIETAAPAPEVIDATPGLSKVEAAAAREKRKAAKKPRKKPQRKVDAAKPADANPLLVAEYKRLVKVAMEESAREREAFLAGDASYNRWRHVGAGSTGAVAGVAERRRAGGQKMPYATAASAE